MITTLVFADDTIACMRVNRKGNRFIVKSMQEYTPIAINQKNDLVNFLKMVTLDISSENDTWYVALSIADTLCTCKAISSMQLDQDDEENDTMRYLSPELDKDDYVAYTVSLSKDNDTSYYTLAYTRKDLITTIYTAFREANLDLLLIEPGLASATRYFHSVFNIANENIELIFIDQTGATILTNELGSVLYKTIGAENPIHSLPLLTNHARDIFYNYKPLDSIICVANIHKYKEQLSLTDIPLSSKIVFLESIPSPIFPIYAGGVLLGDIRKGASFFERKLFGKRNSI